MSHFTHDCIIIGAGPAGLTAAIYLQRFHLRSLVIDDNQSRISAVPRIRNLIGYNNGISGEEFLLRLRRQAAKYKASVIKGEGVIRRLRIGFEVQVGGLKYSAKFAVLAIGIQDVQPPGANHTFLCRKGVLAYCPICDGYDHTNEKIGVLIKSCAGFKHVKFIYTFSKNLHAILIKDIRLPKKLLNEMRDLGIDVHIGELQKLTYDFQRDGLSIKLKDQRAFSVKSAYVELGTKSRRAVTRHLHGLKKIQTAVF